MTLELTRQVLHVTDQTRLPRPNSSFAPIDDSIGLLPGIYAGVSVAQVMNEVGSGWEDFTARVAKPLSAMDLNFVVEPVVATLEEAVGFGAILEGADIRTKVPEYVFPGNKILA